MSNIVIDGGGGGRGESERSPRKSVRKRTVEAEICRRLGLPYYGFLLYHSGHQRLRSFLEQNLSFFDHVTGSEFGIFVLVESHKHPLKVDEILTSNIDADLKNKINKWRQRTVPFTPDRCFEIAEALGIPRRDLPSLVIFRSANGYRTFARLKLKNSWFPEDPKKKDSVNETMKWLSQLFDTLQESMKDKKKKAEAISTFQKRMNSLARSKNIYQPIGMALKENLFPIAKLPFDIVASLSTIVKNVGTSAIQKKVEAALVGSE